MSKGFNGRDGFVFHFEYLEDIPENLRSTWAMYVIDYAQYGIEPSFTDWRDVRDWKRIKSRMEQDSNKWKKRCRNLKNQQEEESDWQAEAVKETLENELEARLEQYGETPVDYSNDVQAEKTETPKKKRFEKPSVEEVDEYCKERKNGIDAQQFVDFYESKGWKVGNVPMRDWKASVRTWEKRQFPHTSPPRYELPADRLTL